MEKIKAYLPSIAAFILTAVFIFTGFLPKFSSANESVYMFTMLADKTGMPFEPFGRFAVGGAELLAVILLWVPGKRYLGGAVAALVLAGALVFHLSGIIGVNTQFPVAGATPPYDVTTPTKGDGGTLFTITLISFALAVYTFISGRKRNKDIG